MLDFVQDKISKREAQQERAAFAKVRNAEISYSIRLRQVARHIGDLIRVFNASDAGQLETLTRVLERYAELLRPWAKSVASQMLADVSRRDEKAWVSYARFLGVELRRQLKTAPVGIELAQLLDDQVDLITSLPMQAARRVQEIAMGQLYTGQRAAVLAEQIFQTGAVTRSRAELIAVTETSRAASALTTVRARYIGCTEFTWRTANDYKVRPLHQKLANRTFRFDDPPVIGENGERGLPGTIYNCFPGSTLVNWSLARKLFRVFYNGTLVSLKVGGEIIEATPNHPMLTQRGWVAAGELNNSDYIACVPLNQNYRIKNNPKHHISTFDEMFCSFRGQSTNSIPGSRFNFYGDTINSNVDQIPINEVLPDKRNISLGQQISDFQFAGADCGAEGAILTSVHNILNSRVTSGLNTIEMLFGCLVGSDNLVSNLPITDFNAFPNEQFTDRHWGNAMLAGNCGDPSTGCVIINDGLNREAQTLLQSRHSFTDTGIDTHLSQFGAQYIRATPNFVGSFYESDPVPYMFCRLEDKRFRDFSGHVYTLETWTGQYGVGAMQMQAKNCRCYVEPLIPYMQ